MAVRGDVTKCLPLDPVALKAESGPARDCSLTSPNCPLAVLSATVTCCGLCHALSCLWPLPSLLLLLEKTVLLILQDQLCLVTH